MDDVLYFNELYDLYSSLLTDKQRQYFEDYYFQNLSFSEMALNYNVSRNAIFKQLKITKDKLEEYEQKLELSKKRKILYEVANQINDKQIQNTLQELI